MRFVYPSMNVPTLLSRFAPQVFAVCCIAALAVEHAAAQAAPAGATAAPAQSTRPSTPAPQGAGAPRQRVENSPAPIPAMQSQGPAIEPTLAINPAAVTNSKVYPDLNGGNPALEEAGALLADLQGKIEQSLPVLYSLMSGRSATASAEASQIAPGGAGGQVPGQIAAPVLPQPTRSGQIFVARAGTNAFAMDAETMRLLYALHNQLQLTLPVLRAVNGLPVATEATNSPLPFANRFSAVPSSPQPQPLVPTGR